jgi:hypothetical protein
MGKGQETFLFLCCMYSHLAVEVGRFEDNFSTKTTVSASQTTQPQLYVIDIGILSLLQCMSKCVPEILHFPPSSIQTFTNITSIPKEDPLGPKRPSEEGTNQDV